IALRREMRELAEMMRDVDTVEVDRFVRGMVIDPKFANEAQWRIVQTLGKLVTTRASQLARRKLAVPDFFALPTRRLLLNHEITNPVAWSSSIVLSVGATPTVAGVNDCLIVVDGDFTGAAGVESSILIVRGNVGRITGVSDSIILATGRWEGALR